MRKSRPIKVLVFGFINMNVIDGSAFFITSLASMLATDPDVNVDVLLANPVSRTLVYNELLDQKNVRVIDPFSIRTAPFPRLTNSGALTHESASEVISAITALTDYDLVILRSTEVAAFVAARSPGTAARSMLYVTGVVSESQGVTPELSDALSACVASGMGLLCQTPEMLDMVAEVVPEDANLICLPPMIPDVPAPGHPMQRDLAECATQFVYTGKFARDWNPIEIMSGFAEVRYDNPSIVLTVAGDQFKRNDRDELFVQKTKYLLQSTPGLEWVGGVERSRARELIRESDVGISWRSPVLDQSLELSTKLLEYGSFGRPCIMNRTPMHERIFGEDYPLYANSMREFVHAMEIASTDSNAYRKAAEISFKASLPYTYSASFDRFLPHLVSHVARVRGVSDEGCNREELLAVSRGNVSVSSAQGTTYVDLRKVGLHYLLNDGTLDIRAGQLVTSIGPIAVFKQGEGNPTVDLDEVVVSRLTAAPVGSHNEDAPGSVTATVGSRSEVELLNGALQRALSDLSREKRKVVVEVGAAHRDFRAARLAAEGQYNSKIGKLSAELASLRQERDELAEVAFERSEEIEKLHGQLSRIRRSKAAIVQQKYWRLMTKLRGKR